MTRMKLIFGPSDVTVERRADGALIVKSPHPLGHYPNTMTEWLDHWARAAPDRVFLAERSTYYGLPEGQRGIFLGGGGSVRIARLIGVPRVQDMMLTGRTLNAEEGHAAGVAQYLVEDGKGLEKAMELAAKAASNTPTTNFAVLHALPRIFESDPTSGLLTESLMASVAELSPEATQRLKDFLEKRAAKILPQS